MAATERVVVLMSPAERAALDAKAAQAGRISAGELIRRAVEAYDEQAESEAEELRALLKVLASTHEETLRQLDRTEQKLDATLAHLAGKSA
jgi:signal transduction histidine kinase